jgi:hypothetical protein
VREEVSARLASFEHDGRLVMSVELPFCRSVRLTRTGLDWTSGDRRSGVIARRGARPILTASCAASVPYAAGWCRFTPWLSFKDRSIRGEDRKMAQSAPAMAQTIEAYVGWLNSPESGHPRRGNLPNVRAFAVR